MEQQDPLFNLINDDDLNHCVDVWRYSLGLSSIAISLPLIKAHLAASPQTSLLLEEAQLYQQTGEFECNETLIDEVFTLLDAQQADNLKH